MSGLWSGQPVSVKLADLDVICKVLDCQIGELLIPEPEKVDTLPQAQEPAAAAGSSGPTVLPRRRAGRSLPPTWPVSRTPTRPAGRCLARGARGRLAPRAPGTR